MKIASSLFAASIVLFLTLPECAQTTPEVRVQTFEKIWNTVDKTFYDSTFGGVDWRKAHDDFGPLAANAKTDEEFYKVIADMLALLKVSHMEAAPGTAVAKMKQPVATIGIGLRSVEGRLTIVRLLQDFPAQKAGLKLGYVVTAINGRKPADLDEAKKYLSGKVGVPVNISYLDEKDLAHEISVERRPLTSSDRGQLGGLSVYALMEAKRLEDGIGYLSFSSFVSFLDTRIKVAMESFHDAPGLIIDLRGNGGGDDEVALKIADMLFDRKTQLMISKKRKGDDLYYKANPSKRPFVGKLVILVDEVSGSASEQLAAGLQEAGRAYVIGKRTAGEDLDADLAKLPDGGIFVYAIGQPRTPKGVIIEGRGVIPDMDVDLRRSDLIVGRDTQIQAAVEYLRGRH